MGKSYIFGVVVITNDVFWMFAKHETEKEKIIREIIERANAGETDFTIQLDDCFSPGDIEEIKKRVMEVLG